MENKLHSTEKIDHPAPGTAIYTVAALLAFAANSIFCRLALRDGSMDPASFTTVRLASGAVMLLVMCMAGRQKIRFNEGWGRALLLFLYAAPFTYAYLRLSAGTGALILFGSVQITMLAWSVGNGHRPVPREWVGLVLAFAGIVYLVSPGVESPSLAGSGLMVVAGVAWGLYTLVGKRSVTVLADTAGNFLRAAIPAILISAIMADDIRVGAEGAGYALASGIFASGIGYAIWYTALRGLTTVRAAVVQLSVPLLTAVAGVVLLSEATTFRLLAASVMILGGIGISISGRRVNSK